MCWFQLLHCEDLLLFFVTSDSKFFGFPSVGRTKETSSLWQEAESPPSRVLTLIKNQLFRLNFDHLSNNTFHKSN